ncbi:9727_t:CDS:2 [Racocetra fulgida]|uniref:9727_t:CDS:1 n=1 Tax=Racocetra fulgida TaxID=60492 RepID=A0A9N9BZI6_9GLOM|nr:9727_t:CDS:2 [Racocetra fulgida]
MSSMPSPSGLTLFQDNDDYDHISNEPTNINNINPDSSDEVNNIISEELSDNKELMELLEVQEKSEKENEENIGLENLIKGLKLFQIKDKHNMSEAAFNEILKVLEIPNITLYKLEKYLENLVPLKLTLIDCCINTCIAFTDNLANKNICPRCKESRYKSDKLSKVPQ